MTERKFRASFGGEQQCDEQQCDEQLSRQRWQPLNLLYRTGTRSGR